MIEVNEVKEIFLYGIHRSGNHGLINYLLGHIFERLPEKKCKKILKEKQKNPQKNRLLLRKENIHINLAGRYRLGEKTPPAPKHVPFQILSHENTTDIKLNKNQLMYDTGRKKANKKCIILLRDPYNTLASLIEYDSKKGRDRKFIEKRVDYTIDIWKNFAKEFFLVEDLPSWVMPVSFNKWFSDEDYRKEISDFIGEPHSDLGLNLVSSIGSSFNKYHYSHKAQEMKVLDRYKEMPDYYKNILKEDKEIRSMSESIFNF